MQNPLSLEETTEKFIRKDLRKNFKNLLTQPIENYLKKFGFKSEMIMGMYAVTDGFSGLSSGFGELGAGFYFISLNEIIL